jgi:hypothetical protein
MARRLAAAYPILVERTLIVTSNPNYAPSVILLGAFLVPVTFVTYLYERLPTLEVPLPALAVCFLWGGVLGTVVAGSLEYEVASSLGFLPKLAIDLIEESAKIIVPLGFYLFGRYRSEAAGIVLGGYDSCGLRLLGDDGLRVRLLAAVQRQPGRTRRGALGARPQLACRAYVVDRHGVRHPVEHLRESR